MSEQTFDEYFVDLMDTQPEIVTDEDRAKSEDALDRLTDQAIDAGLNELKTLLDAATPGIWTESSKGRDAVIAEGLQTASDPDCHRYYGGRLVFESCNGADKRLICALKRWAPGFIAMGQDYQALRRELENEKFFCNAFIRVTSSLQKENNRLKNTPWNRLKNLFKRFVQ